MISGYRPSKNVKNKRTKIKVVLIIKSLPPVTAILATNGDIQELAPSWEDESRFRSFPFQTTPTLQE